MTASKSCNCVMGMAMRKTPQTSTKMPREKLAEAMVSPTEGSEAHTVSKLETEVRSSSDLESPTLTSLVTTRRMPRSVTWPRLHTDTMEPESEDEVIKR